MSLFKISTALFFVLCPLSAISVKYLRSEHPDDNIRILAQMTRNVTIRYFSDFRCVLIVAENCSEEDVAGIIPGDIGRYYVYINKQMENYSITEKIILKSLDEKCLGLIIQVSDPVRIIQTVTKLLKMATTRANRRFFFLPLEAATGTHNQYSLAVDNVFRMREIDFYPELLVARFQTRKRVELVTQKFIGETAYKEQVILDIWTERFV